ncbi:purinergic receptor P2X, ligand-gated ion channel, 8 isoform X2 [Carassius carassius]|uniref:purinergic receptor P2X, ligand-gated ion channel, 8 isoform X2 n=1 Tax=Carassius carassius TaxID=217509 RepID=UPI002868D656|nr:purinergic receptor P2X, ligand-gated ion channel, 8 isoform X2 [Carassius carassius]
MSTSPVTGAGMAWQNSQNHLLFLFEYTTVKYVDTHNRKIGLLYRIFQLTIMGYLIGWVFLKNKGYQVKDDTIESSVVTKVKGVARVNTTDSNLWGPEDYVFPNQGENFLSIITNFIETKKQTLGNCSENPDVPNNTCSKNEECTAGEAVRAGNGIKTGVCLIHNRTCEIYGWCPTERHRDPDPTNIVREAENFTLYIRNFIRFSQFNFSASNVPKENRKLLFKHCTYDETLQPYCPIFRLGDIVNKTGHKFEELALRGVSIGVLIEWLCDLDKDSECRPRYSFVCLDKVSFDFRFARYSTDAAGQRQRTFYKAFGIHLDIMVFGVARRFNIIPTIVNIASALTLMAAGSYICDIMLLYAMKKRSVYTESKLDRVTMNDKEIPLQIMPEGLRRKFSL